MKIISILNYIRVLILDYDFQFCFLSEVNKKYWLKENNRKVYKVLIKQLYHINLVQYYKFLNFFLFFNILFFFKQRNYLKKEKSYNIVLYNKFFFISPVIKSNLKLLKLYFNIFIKGNIYCLFSNSFFDIRFKELKFLPFYSVDNYIDTDENRNIIFTYSTNDIIILYYRLFNRIFDRTGLIKFFELYLDFKLKRLGITVDFFFFIVNIIFKIVLMIYNTFCKFFFNMYLSFFFFRLYKFKF
jgi:hypothetical protein